MNLLNRRLAHGSLLALVTIFAPTALALDLTSVTAYLDKLEEGGTKVAFTLLDPAGNSLLDRNGDKWMKPASNNKLFTVASALELLGPDFRTSTVIRLTGPLLPDGTVDGSLIISGYGDPTISGRFETDITDTTAPMRRMAEQLTSAGIRRITGGLLVDDSYFGQPTFHPRWPAEERGEWYSAEVSALSFNDNCVDLRWSGQGILPGNKASVTMLPANSYVTLVNEVLVGATGRPAGRNYTRGPNDNVIRAVGQIPVDNSTLDSAAIHDGALWFGSIFRDVLTSSGIEVLGDVRHATPADQPASGTPLYEFPSPPLSAILNVINRNSQNFYAECVVRLLGALPQTRDLDPEATGAPGSWERGTAVTSFAAARILDDKTRPVMADGSGLSHANRTTARQLARLIFRMSNSRYQKQWKDSLAQGATRGSLRKRFLTPPLGPTYAARIYGKTGLISGVRALSGEIETPNGPCVFSLVVNDIPPNRAGAIIPNMDAAVLAAAHAVLSSPLEVRHPIADVEPPSDKPLNVNPRTPNVPIPDPPPPFAVGKILNETSKQWFGRMQQFEKEFLSPGFTTGGIVLIGDSLTERFPTKDLLPGLPIVNRGIGGDKIGGSSYLGVRDRLEASVTRVAPIAIVLLIGTNDIVFARTDPGNMRQNYRTLISEIEQLAPEARLLLVSVPPAAGRFAQYSKEIADFNKFIEELAKARGLDFIDLHSALRGPDGLLPKALTTDDLHLSEEGYRIYARILRPILGTTLRQSPFQRRPMVPGSH